jgi:murein DD-endopeptidase MepM/ murein hydrolase activator NlpD
VAAAIALTSAVCLQLAVATADADDLDDRRKDLRTQIAQSRADLSESSTSLSRAAVNVDRTEAALTGARAALAQTRTQLAAAAAADRTMAAKLDTAKTALAKARLAVVAGERRLAEQKTEAGKAVRDQLQQSTALMPIAAVLQKSTAADLAARLQWSTTLFGTQAAEIDRLTTYQRRLDAARAKATRLEEQVAEARKAAAANLETKRRLEAQRRLQEQQVSRLLTRLRGIERKAAGEVAVDKRRYQELTREAAAVERRIAARIRAAKAAAAEAAAKAKAAARARQRSEALRRAKLRKESSDSSGGARAGHGFILPVPGHITSPYGMRFHPILRYRKLHDGTDFGASCGTPIKAPYAGKVAERYFNAGYGNRLMIDHGEIDGRYVTTGFNHAQRYTVSVGDRVEQGQTIGYVGSTGYSTGCHLHLMTWLDGSRRNPMSWF